MVYKYNHFKCKEAARQVCNQESVAETTAGARTFLIGLTTHELSLLPQPMFWRMEAAVKANQMMRDDWFGFFALKRLR